ncbi:MAG: carboxypeptidase M32 [Minisyncoccota bacterium]
MKTQKENPMVLLKARLAEIAQLGSVFSVLGWDQEVHMPEKGADARAATISLVSGLMHEKLVGLDDDGLLSRLKKQVDAKELKGKDAIIVAETWRSFEREKKLPEAFVKELAETASKAHHVWIRARRENDFGIFLPWLRKLVELKRTEAGLVGFADSPYDALLDSYEPGLTAKDAAVVLNDLKDFLVPFLKELRASKVKIDQKRIRGAFPLDKQLAFNSFVSEKMGFDYAAGRIDKSVHPFTTTFHTNDVRITTRFKQDDVIYSLGSTIHETGHALYEQGLPSEHFGTPLAEAVSLGIHESQSRLWENNIGKSAAFWRYFYPKLQKEFPEPFKQVPLKDFLRIINEVKPSLIRTEADEVTYNLHVIIRFEIEKELIEGSIDPKDLPAIWNEKMRKYLGIKVPSDTLGVLQDVHWSTGSIGYFPTYTLGNLYAAQFYAAMKRDLPDLSARIAAGDLAVPREWLRKKIHAHGKTYAAADLVKKVTGEYPTSRYFIDYLRDKYEKLYS